MNETLLQRCSGGGEGWGAGEVFDDNHGGSGAPAPSLADPAGLLAAVRARLDGEQEVAKLEALRWVHALMAGGSRQVRHARLWFAPRRRFSMCWAGGG